MRLNHSLARRHVENQVAGLMANLEMMLDEAMTTCSEKAYSLSTTPTPVYEIKKQCHFALRDFVKYACRPAETSKSCTFIFDVHYNVPELGIISSLCERLQDQDYSVLPPHLRPGESMPPGTTVSYFLISFASCPFLQRPKQKKHVRGALASHWYLPSGRVHGHG